MYFVSTPVFISLLLRGHPVVPGTQRNKFLAKVYSHEARYLGGARNRHLELLVYQLNYLAAQGPQFN